VSIATPTAASRPPWTNWARTVAIDPSARLAPRSTAEVQSILTRAARAGLRVKAVGSGHSFTSVATSDGVMLTLGSMVGGLQVDSASQQVVVPAGMALHRLNAELASHGPALANLGDIDRQTISGALATGTHGTGARFPGLAAQVVAVTAVLADGSVVTASATREPALFHCLRLGLGAFGVITDVRLQCVPAFSLRAEEVVVDVDDVLADLDAWVSSSDHFEFHWFPHSSHAIVKRNTRGPAGPRQSLPQRLHAWVNDEVTSNGLLEVLCRAEALRPDVIPRLNAVKGHLLSDRTYADDSYRVFASRRRVRFREMEYAFDRRHAAHLVREIDAWTRSRHSLVNFPIEVRWAAGDDVWLSTAYQQPCAYIAVHQHERLPYEDFFSGVEAMMRAVSGRPHWGKLHTLGSAELAELYPRFEDAVAVRHETDPRGLFANDYLDRVLGPAPESRRAGTDRSRRDRSWT
jgi:FAD-linked oxidoreductase